MRQLWWIALLCCGGCGAGVYYPGDRLVYVTLDLAFTTLMVADNDGTVKPAALLIGDGLRYWDVMGARLRTRWQLTPEDDLTGAPELHITYGHDESNGGRDGVYYPDGTLYLYDTLLNDGVADNLRDCAAHETGHAMGLNHTPGDPDAVMNPATRPRTKIDDTDMRQFMQVVWSHAPHPEAP